MAEDRTAAGVMAWAERHPRLAFVALQLVVWGTFYGTQYLSLLPRLTPDERGPFLVIELTMLGTAPLLSTVLHGVYRRLPGWPVPGGPAGRLLAILLAVWAASHLWVIIDGRVFDLIVRYSSIRFDWTRISSLMRGSYWLTLLSWTGGYFVVRFWRESQERERRLLEVQLLARDAQLRALAYQLNPHFLFNALNSLRALVLEDAARAREMITRLSTFLRHTLAVPEHAVNSVAAEMDGLRAYLAIEQVRFEERLRVTWDISPDVESFEVPSLVVQPLVENAVRHGVAPGDALEIVISAQRRGHMIIIGVSNTGRLDDVRSADGGVGLENVRARLAHAFPGRHELPVRSGDGWVHVELRIAVED